MAVRRFPLTNSRRTSLQKPNDTESFAHIDMPHSRPLSLDSVGSLGSPIDPRLRKKVAVVGGGCAGIAALWALNRSHHDVYLYEAAPRLGGHTNTVKWTNGKYETDVDTGFIVLNTATYPNFINFLKRIKVDTEKTEMTFSVTRDRGAFEWAGTTLDAIFCQRKNIFSPRMWRMIFDIIRFNQFAIDLLINDEDEGYDFRDRAATAVQDGSRGGKREETIGEYLKREDYSDAFRDDYLIPMTAAVWSTGPEKSALEFPAVTLVRFLWNHHLLSTITARPDWLTLKDCGKSYIDAVMRGFPSNHLFLNTKVSHVSNGDDGRVRLHLPDGSSEVYDHVILATHGDEARRIIEPSATVEEKAVMSSFETSENTVVLHSDTSLMPTSRKAWTSWNYLTSTSSNAAETSASSTSHPVDKVCLTYNMNILQHIPTSLFGDVLVTMNPLHPPAPSKTRATFTYNHPLYTPEAVRAQRALEARLQNTRGISYAGAWTGYGFHEDGFSSGLRVARDHLGARLPFDFVDSTYSRGRRPVLRLRDLLLRVILLFLQVFVVKVLERILSGLKETVEPRVEGAKRIVEERVGSSSDWKRRGSWLGNGVLVKAGNGKTA